MTHLFTEKGRKALTEVGRNAKKYGERINKYAIVTARVPHSRLKGKRI